MNNAFLNIPHLSLKDYPIAELNGFRNAILLAMKSSAYMRLAVNSRSPESIQEYQNLNKWLQRIDSAIEHSSQPPHTTPEFPLYTWVPGILNYKIQVCKDSSGQFETIAQVWKFQKGAVEMAIQMTKALNQSKKEIPV